MSAFEVTRRQLLVTAAAAAATAAAAGPARAASLVQTGRPVLTHGIQSGDAAGSSAVVWTHADRASRMLVEVSSRPDFANAQRLRGPVLSADGDFTGKLRLCGLPQGRRVHVRVRAEGERGVTSEPVTGSLVVPGGAGDTKSMTVRLCDQDGVALWSTTLPAAR